MTSVSYGEVNMILLDSLRNMTNIVGFNLPSVEEWQYAAHGGKHHEKSTYVGSDDVKRWHGTKIILAAKYIRRMVNKARNPTCLIFMT